MLVVCGKNNALMLVAREPLPFWSGLVSNDLPSSKKNITFAIEKVYFVIWLAKQ